MVDSGIGRSLHVFGKSGKAPILAAWLPVCVQIQLAKEPVGLLKSISSLYAEVEKLFGDDPMSGHSFVFFNRTFDPRPYLRDVLGRTRWIPPALREALKDAERRGHKLSLVSRVLRT